MSVSCVDGFKINKDYQITMKVGIHKLLGTFKIIGKIIISFIYLLDTLPINIYFSGYWLLKLFRGHFYIGNHWVSYKYVYE